MWALNPNKMGGQATMLVVLYAVPGAANDRLRDEFETVIHTPPHSTWEDSEIAGQHVRVARGKDFDVAYWPTNGVVFQVGGPPSHIDGFISRLSSRSEPADLGPS
jgi:hypothetical protein